MDKPTKQIIDYYHSKESLLGYKLLLGGTKHFGFYPVNDMQISMKVAMNNMIDKLAKKNNIHKNNAANLKRGLTLHINAMA